MADRYWVGGTASWDATAGSKWATTSGGAGGQTVPGAGDRAIFDTNSGAVTVTIAAAATCLDLECVAGTGGPFAGTLAGSSTLAISGSLAFSAGMTRSYTGAITFNATSGTKTITSNGKTFGGTITFNGAGGTWQLADAFSSSSSITLTSGTFDTNGKTISTANLINNGSTTRVLQLHNSVWTLTGTGNVWNTVATGFTFTPGGTSKLVINEASASAKSMAAGTSITYDDISFTGGGAFTISGTTAVFRDFLISSAVVGSSFAYTTASITVRNIDFTGFVGTWAATQTAINVTQTVTLASGMTNSNAATVTFTDTSGTTRAITCNTKSFAGPIVFNGVGGVWQLADTFSSTSSVTLTNGSFSFNNQNFTAGSFISNGSTTRTITIGTSQITITGTGTPWNIVATLLTLTASASSKISISDAGGTTKVVTPGTGFTYGDIALTGGGQLNLGGATWRDVLISSATATGFAFSATTTVRNLDFTGFTGVWSAASIANFTGNLVCVSGMGTITATSPLNFIATSGTQTITCGGKTLAGAVTENGVGGTLQFADAFLSSSSITLTNGTLDTNAKNVTASALNSNNTNVRTLTITNSAISLTGTVPIGLSTGTNVTTNASGSTITCTAGGACALGAGFVLNDLVWQGTTTAGGMTNHAGTWRDITMSGSQTFSVSGTSPAFRNFDASAYTGTIGGNQILQIQGGNLAISATGTFGLQFLFNGTAAGTQTITSNGGSFANALVVNNPNTTVRLADALICNTFSGLTLTNGAFDFNGKNATLIAFASSNSNVRSLTLGTAQITMTGVGNQWNVNTSTNLTFSAGATSKIMFNNASASPLAFLTGGAGLSYGDIAVTGAGSGTFTFFGDLTCRDITISAGSRSVVTGTTTARNLNWTGSTSVWTGSLPVSLSGNLTLGGSAPTYGGTVSFVATSGTQVIRANGWTASYGVTVDAPGATVQAFDAFSAQAFILTHGTFDSNSQTVSIQSLSSNNFNTRSLIFDNSAVTIFNANGAALSWDTGNTSGMTTSVTGSTIHAFGGVWESGPIMLNDFVWDGTTFLQFIAFSGTFRDATFNDNGDPVTGYVFNCDSSNFTCRNFDMSGVVGTVKQFNVTTSVVNVSGSLNVGTQMDFQGSGFDGFSFVGSAGTQGISGTSALTTMSIYVSGAAVVQFNNAVSVNDLQIDGFDRRLRLKSGATHTVNGQFNAHAGAAGHLNVIDSTTPGVAGRLVKQNGQSVNDYLDIQDVSFGGGALWFVGAHSTMGSDVYGARFTSFYASPPTARATAPLS